jgi:hypothetical protein
MLRVWLRRYGSTSKVASQRRSSSCSSKHWGRIASERAHNHGARWDHRIIVAAIIGIALFEDWEYHHRTKRVIVLEAAN